MHTGTESRPMLPRLLDAFSTALRIRRLGMIHGEALAWHYGEEGLERAVAHIAETEADSPERMLAIWIARYARKRLDELSASPSPERERLGARWRRRRGSLMADGVTLQSLVGDARR